MHRVITPHVGRRVSIPTFTVAGCRVAQNHREQLHHLNPLLAQALPVEGACRFSEVRKRKEGLHWSFILQWRSKEIAWVPLGSVMAGSAIRSPAIQRMTLHPEPVGMLFQAVDACVT
jgi:hypothetical protein